MLRKSYKIASQVLSYLREGEERTDSTPVATTNAREEVNAKVLSAINDVSQKLDIVARDIVGKVTQKLEQDQLEKLAAQVRTVKLGLELDNEGILTTSLVHITEQIEYAKNRLAEDKREWLGPWLMAEAVRIAALRAVSGGERAMTVLNRGAMSFRLNILDYTRDLLLKTGRSPWLKIAEFVEGRNEDVLRLVENMSSDAIATQPKAVILDDLGDETVATFTCVRISKGSTVKIGDVLLEYEVDKSITEHLANEPGVVSEIMVKQGEQLKRGAVLLTFQQD
ncbi:biotin/lipoyl-containing protein [Paraburkholderia agricolaris]|uniref:biotin/lipoyl-containing protein n=1 Tax=Paraburkholderia agricolaris TaxID=2152888 RepID=UPI001291AC17|nr:biotin/lipoyl-containing protein [Paraburkholderia agricolaris]